MTAGAAAACSSDQPPCSSGLRVRVRVWGRVPARTHVFNAIWHRVICWGWEPCGSRCLSVCCARSLGTGGARGGDEWAQPTGMQEPFKRPAHPPGEGERGSAYKGHASEAPPLPHPPSGVSGPVAARPPSHGVSHNKTPHQNLVIFWHCVRTGKKPGVEYFIGSSEGENQRLPRKRNGKRVPCPPRGCGAVWPRGSRRNMLPQQMSPKHPREGGGEGAQGLGGARVWGAVALAGNTAASP